MKKTILIVGTIAAIILLIGIYKFNFTNNDIDAKDLRGKSLSTGTAKSVISDQIGVITELKTKTGKIITITETHPIGQSISSVTISTKGFRENKLIQLEDIDPIERVILNDLDNNGFEELYLFTRSSGSGSEGNFYAYASDKDEKLVKCEKETIGEMEFTEGFMGHNTYIFNKDILIMEYRSYKENDVNSKPSGKAKKIFYKLNRTKFKIIKME